MPDGFRVANAYVALTLDRDQLRRDIAGLPGELDGEVDAAGREMGDRLGSSAGDRIGRHIGDGIGNAPVEAPSTRKGTEAGDRFGSSFSSKVRAALAALPPVDVNLDDEYAQAKLDYIRQELLGLGNARIGVDVSDADAIAKLTVLRSELDELGAVSPSVQVKVDTAMASAEIDKFLTATEVKAEAAGKVAGQRLSSGMASSSRSMSPLIVSAIVGGLLAGGPLVSAAGVLLFGGLSAAAASNVGAVQDSFHALAAHVMNDVQSIAEQTSGQFVAMAGDIEAGFDRLEPSIRTALTGVAPELREIVGAFMDGAQSAIPAFTRAIQQGQPVVQGLDALIRDLGSGVAGMMDALTAHSGAEGQVLSELGDTIHILLPAVGQLLGEGAELGSTVLPVLNTALQWTSDILHTVGPVLPEVAAGFAAFKVVSLLSGPLGTFSAKLQTTAADADGLKGKLAGLGAQGVSGLNAALPVLGVTIGIVTAAMESQQQTANQWAQALLQGGRAAESAKSQMADLQGAVDSNLTGWGGFTELIGGNSLALATAARTTQDAKDKYKELQASMSPLEKAQQDVTKATNDYTLAVQRHGEGSSQAAAKAEALSSAEQHLTTMNNEVKTATEGATTASQNQQTALQGISDKASAANTQIQLLKGALDALTGANMTADQAEIAVTQAVAAATQAVQGKTAALSFTNGQLDLSNAKSAQAAQLLMNLAGTQHQEIATLEQQGASQDVVSQKADQMRQQFIQTAIQMGANAQEAQALADRYFGIPGQVATNIVAYDNSSAVIQRIQNLIAGLHDKNIFITTYERVVSSGPAGLGGAAHAQALGGIAVPMAAGGVIGMADGGSAGIFQPNDPMFLIGDNKKVRESFIPQDGSTRSKTILRETASEMGYALTPTTGGGQANGGTAGATVTVQNLNVTLRGVWDLSDGKQLRKVGTVIRDELVKIERSAR